MLATTARLGRRVALQNAGKIGAVRSFSSASAGSSQGFSTATAATAAAVGIISLVTLGRGGKKAEAKGPEAVEKTVEVTVEASVAPESSLSSRVAALESVVAELIATKKNSAFVFIKPHAVTEAVDSLIKSTFAKENINILGEGELGYEEIEKKQLIDTHYGAIASKAVSLKPSELNVPIKGKIGFKRMFNESWNQAVQDGKVYNAKEICEKLGIDGDQLEMKWRDLKRGQNLIKFGGGFYCGQIEHEGQKYFVINGFYMSMRSKYTAPPAKIHYYVVEWSPSSLSWEDFRGKVLGGTDPVTAEANSLRRAIYEDWEKLGLPAMPDVGDNGVHASASPFEAFAERCNWLEQPVEEDTFGKALLMSGVDKTLLESLMGDAQVSYQNKKQSVFDLLEDLDVADCFSKTVDIAKKQA